jgi:homoserine dehydrogenase
LKNKNLIPFSHSKPEISMSSSILEIAPARVSAPTEQSHQIALFGFGNVGSGFHDAFSANPIQGWEIGPIVVKNLDKRRSLPSSSFSYDWEKALRTESLALVVETLNDPDAAYTLIKTALQRGIPVVSASKAVLAKHLPEFTRIAKATGAKFLYEASTGGAIPILRLLRTHYRQEKVNYIEGIVNGTSNYILTRMNEGAPYADALLEAQALGFAETDPTADVDGFDAANKLIILAYHAFGQHLQLEDIAIRGIRTLNEATLIDARADGRRARLVASVRRTADGKLQAQIAPRLVTDGSPLYYVEREYNAILVEGPFSGTQTFIGRGAGAHPTGSAVLADVAEIAATLLHPQTA